MTRTRVLEPNTRLALKLFGMPPEEAWDGEGVPDYGADLQSASLVADALRHQGWLVILKWMPDGFPFLGSIEHDRKYWAPCLCELQWMGRHQKQPRGMRLIHGPFAFADTMAEAICKAALLALDAMADEGVPIQLVTKGPSTPD